MTGYIYGLYENNENDIFYIGSSVNPESRVKQHNGLKRNCDPDSHAYKQIIKPKNNFKYIIIDEIEFNDRKELSKLEVYWICQFKAWGFILTNGTTYRTNHYLRADTLNMIKEIQNESASIS